MRDILSFICIFAGIFWFSRRAQMVVLEAAGASATRLVDLMAEFEALYLKATFFTLLWVFVAIALGCHGSANACITLQLFWNFCLIVLYCRSYRVLKNLAGIEQKAVNHKAGLRFWGVLIAFFVLSSYATRAFESSVSESICAFFGVPYHAWGGDTILMHLLLCVEMFFFVFISPWVIRFAFSSRRESDARVLDLVKKVFARAKIPAPRIVRMDIGRSYFAAIAGFRISFLHWQPTLFLSDALVQGLEEAELEAVIAHELVHVQRNHLLKRVAWFIGLLFFFGTFCYAAAIGLGSRLLAQGWLLPVEYKALNLFFGLFTIFILIWSLRKVVRHQETEADAYAVADFGANAHALVSALDKILAVVKRSRTKQSMLSWIIPAAAHPTVAEREVILLRADRRARFGLDPLRRFDRPFISPGFFPRFLRLSFYAFALWILPLGALEVQRFEANDGLREKAMIGDLEAMRYLITHGASPLDGSALFAAVKSGKTEAVSLLLMLGANPAWRNERGETSYELARKAGHLQLAAYLDAMEGGQRLEAKVLRSPQRSLASQSSQ
jgi:Zn-dependent protease with chaperone function